jgi:1-acyl-sn-glycerol-3-phosphate acyltransferase
MMTPIAALVLTVSTILAVAGVVLASLFGVPLRHGSVYEKIQRAWAKSLVLAAGARTRVHGAEHISQGHACVYLANHVSWYDVFALGSVLPRWSFVAKAELRKIPIFGRGAVGVGTIFVERRNRQSAIQMYEQAAQRIGEGASVVVFPEGTRGDDYALRPFKRGGFVLATTAGIPIIPVVIHGTRHVMRRGTWTVRPGVVDIHFLPPVPTAGLSYADRDVLIAQVWSSMAATLASEHGVESDRRHAIGSGDVVPSERVAPESGVVTQ